MNLIPTLRVDRNGRTVTRHMKPEAAAAVRKLIPTAPPAAASSPEPLMSNSEIAQIISGDHAAISEDTIDIMRDYDGGDSVDSASRFLVTGSDTGRAMAAEDFLRAAQHVQRRNVQDEQGYELLGNVVSAWAAGNVLDETAENIDYSLLGNMRYKHYKLCKDVPNDDPSHWRGLAVLDLADFGGAGSDKDSREFVEWAGRQTDISLIIRMARERKTINVEALRGLIEQGLTEPLQEGAL